MTTSLDIPGAFLDVLLPHLPYADGRELVPSDDLAALGLDSMGVIQLLGDLEDRFDLELPDELMTEDTFSTLGALWLTVAELVPPEKFAPGQSGDA